jgi:hypothetical protein
VRGRKVRQATHERLSPGAQKHWYAPNVASFLFVGFVLPALLVLGLLFEARSPPRSRFRVGARLRTRLSDLRPFGAASTTHNPVDFRQAPDWVEPLGNQGRRGVETDGRPPKRMRAAANPKVRCSSRRLRQSTRHAAGCHSNVFGPRPHVRTPARSLDIRGCHPI